jgi:high frequency lysogenization protein
MNPVPALSRNEAQTLALAGIVQAVHLALLVARQGDAEPGASATSLNSVLRFSADTAEDIYGGLPGLRFGLRMLVAQLQGAQRDADLLRIVATVMSLERKYARRHAMQNELRERLQAIARELTPEQAGETALIDALAKAYLATISTLTPRIRVTGNPTMLKEDVNVARIRAYLLAALRSAALWRQLGGRGWRLLLGRKQLGETAQRLLGRSLALV